MHTLHPEFCLPLPIHSIPPGCHRAPGLGALHHTTNSLAICFTYGNACVSMLFSQIIPSSSSHHELKSLFLHLCLLYCPACRIIGTIFLNSICMYVYIYIYIYIYTHIYINIDNAFLFLTYHSV